MAATIGRIPAGGFQATVAVFNPLSGTAPGESSALPNVVIRLPGGFSLTRAPQIARDVLYSNTVPSFAYAGGGVGSILAGAAPSMLPPAQIVRDAQQLALERSVRLVDVGLLGLQYVAAQFSRTGPASFRVTIGLFQSSQVNAVELGFPTGTNVVHASGPPTTDSLLLGNIVRLISSSGFYQDGIQYSFTLRLSRPAKRGDFVTLRASTHYFEGSLPFTERFVLP